MGGEEAKVAIVMGSRSDWPTMTACAEVLKALEIPYEVRVISAHRTPDRCLKFAQGAEACGIRVIIAAAGGAAHLAGVIAALTHLPVLGVPMKGWALDGLDSLLSMVQMPGGIPVPTLSIGKAGARNAALAAAAILALGDPAVRERLLAWRRAQSDAVPETVEDE